MGYGTSPYGTSTYGSLSSITTLSVNGAWAISTHGVRVVLTSEPLHVDPYGAGDALNPLSWTVVDTTTGRALTVVAAAMGADAVTVDLSTLEALGDHLEIHTVTAVGLFSFDGFFATAPLSATFTGVVQTMDPVDAARADGFRDRDLANQPFQIARGLGAAGTLQIGADGDFDTESGLPLIRKLVLRRLNTKRNAFRHLPGYGLEIAEKEPIASGGDLITLLRDVEEQAKQEPDVERAVAHGSLDRSGVAIVQLSMSARGGSSISMRMGAVAGRLMEV